MELVGSKAQKATVLKPGVDTAESYTDALPILGAGGTGAIFGAASGKPTMLTGQMQAIRGYTLFTEMTRVQKYAGELFGYLQADKWQRSGQTYPVADVQTAHLDTESHRTHGKAALVF